MASFHLPFNFSIYRSLFLSYVSIEIILSEKKLRNSSRWNPPATPPTPVTARPARRSSPPLLLWNQMGSPLLPSRLWRLLFHLPFRWDQTLLPLSPPRMQTKSCSSEMFHSAHAKRSWGFVWFTSGRLEIHSRKPSLDKRCSLSMERSVSIFFLIFSIGLVLLDWDGIYINRCFDIIYRGLLFKVLFQPDGSGPLIWQMEWCISWATSSGPEGKFNIGLLIISLPSHSPGILFYRFLRTLRYQFQMIGSGSTAMRSLRPTVTLGVTFMVSLLDYWWFLLKSLDIFITSNEY